MATELLSNFIIWRAWNQSVLSSRLVSITADPNTRTLRSDPSTRSSRIRHIQGPIKYFKLFGLSPSISCFGSKKQILNHNLYSRPVLCSCQMHLFWKISLPTGFAVIITSFMKISFLICWPRSCQPLFYDGATPTIKFVAVVTVSSGTCMFVVSIYWFLLYISTL